MCVILQNYENKSVYGSVFLRRSLLVITALLFIATLFAAPAAAWTGAGTSADPYKITSEADLIQLSTDTNAGNYYAGKYFQLTKDIVLTKPFLPIGGGNSQTGFQGNFDGKNYTISNLTNVDASLSGGVGGLFGYVTSFSGSVTIQNLNVQVSSVPISSSPYWPWGGLVGQAKSCNIVNCHVVVDCDIRETGTTGGLVGLYGKHYNANAGEIRNSSAIVKGSIVVNSNPAKVDPRDSSAGGLVGRLSSESTSITNSYAQVSGDIIGWGTAGVGGLLGASPDYWATVTNCYAAVGGNVYAYGDTNSMVGGLVGPAGYDGITVTNCYAVVAGELGPAPSTASYTQKGPLDAVSGLVGGEYPYNVIVKNSVALATTLNASTEDYTLINHIAPGPGITSSYANVWMQSANGQFSDVVISNAVSPSQPWGQKSWWTEKVGFAFSSSAWTMSTAEGYQLPILAGSPEPVFDVRAIFVPSPLYMRSITAGTITSDEAVVNVNVDPVISRYQDSFYLNVLYSPTNDISTAQAVPAVLNRDTLNYSATLAGLSPGTTYYLWGDLLGGKKVGTPFTTQGGSVTVTTLSELKTALAGTPTTIILGADISVTEQLIVDRAVTLTTDGTPRTLNLSTATPFFLFSLITPTSDLTLTGNGAGTLTLNGNKHLYSDAPGGRRAMEIRSGTLTINDGTVITNFSSDYAPAFVAYAGAHVTMNGGKITNNSVGSTLQSAVLIDSVTAVQTVFIMNGGEISSTTGSPGVRLSEGDPLFIMNGGIITNNTGASSCGGLYVGRGTFIMNGGTITNNTASGASGNELYLASPAKLILTGTSSIVGTAKAVYLASTTSQVTVDGAYTGRIENISTATSTTGASIITISEKAAQQGVTASGILRQFTLADSTRSLIADDAARIITLATGSGIAITSPGTPAAPDLIITWTINGIDASLGAAEPVITLTGAPGRVVGTVKTAETAKSRTYTTTLAGLSPATAYTLKITHDGYTASRSFTTAASAVATVSVTAARNTPTSATFTITTTNGDGIAPVLSYWTTADTTKKYTAVVTPTGTAGKWTVTISDLLANTAYSYSADYSGKTSTTGTLASTTYTLQITSPSSDTATGISTSPLISWKISNVDQALPAVEPKITISGGAGEIIGTTNTGETGTDRTYQTALRGLAFGTKYTIKIEYDGASASRSFTTETAPAVVTLNAPTILAGSLTETGAAYLIKVDNVADNLGAVFLLYSTKNDADNATAVAAVPSGSNTGSTRGYYASLENLAPGTQYYIWSWIDGTAPKQGTAFTTLSADISIDKRFTTLTAGTAATLTTTGGSGTTGIEWTTNNPGVLEIDWYSGEITAHKAGKAKITATGIRPDGSTTTASLVITVKAEPPVSTAGWNAVTPVTASVSAGPEELIKIPTLARGETIGFINTCPLDGTIAVTAGGTPAPYTRDGNTLKITTPETGKTYTAAFTGRKLGDVNNDGKIDVIDALKITRYAAELDALDEYQLVCGDINGLAGVTAKDALAIMEYTVGIRNADYRYI